MDAVRGIFARENGQGMFFEVGAQETLFTPADEDKHESGDGRSGSGKSKKRPTLKIVK